MNRTTLYGTKIEPGRNIEISANSEHALSHAIMQLYVTIIGRASALGDRRHCSRHGEINLSDGCLNPSASNTNEKHVDYL
jgi:hypothetical protein